MDVLACNTSYGAGGLGRHFMELVEESRTHEQLQGYYAPGVRTNDPRGQVVITTTTNSLRKYTPLRYFPGWNNHLANDEFDRRVASQLRPTDRFIGFVGSSLSCFQRMRQLGCKTLVLHAANSHVNNVYRQHHKAIDRFGIEDSWLNQTQCEKTKREYALADLIYVASDYTRATFLAEGILPEKIKMWQLNIAPRFKPALERPKDDVFRIIYVGSITVMKGIPILLEAFAKFPAPNAELILVGGWATRGMKRYLQNWLTRDPRIRLQSGDPLPHLQQADVFVHPTYEDGFAYAPAEALACGVPVIVTADTGMKSLIQEGINGHIIPTGDENALLEKLNALYNKPLVGKFT
jgi:glycosyltransferase involved in cell wall biosynthesis